MPSRGCNTPVLLSPWVTNTRSGLCCFTPASICSRVKLEPVAVVISVTVAPCLLAMSALLIPQMPLLQIMTVLPGSSMLVITHSMAACPVADRARVIGLLVWKMYWTPALISSMILENSVIDIAGSGARHGLQRDIDGLGQGGGGGDV